MQEGPTNVIIGIKAGQTVPLAVSLLEAAVLIKTGTAKTGTD